MTSPDAPGALPRRVLGGAAGIVALAGFTALVLLGLSGHLGQSLYGFRLHSAPSSAAEHWLYPVVAGVAASVGILLGPLRWSNGLRPLPLALPLGLLAASTLGAVAAPNVATWFSVFLPGTAAAACYLAFRAWWRSSEPLATAAAWPIRQLSASVALGATHMVFCVLVALSYRS